MESMTVTIEKIVSGGYGFVRLSEEKVVFVPFSLPGEELEIALFDQKKNYAFGKILEIKKPSPQRIASLCPLFGTCGGCQFQMTDYPTQLIHKKFIIEESVRRIAKLDVPVNDPIPADNPFFYRNKGSFQVFGTQELGYCKPGTTVPFAIESCPIMEEAINAKIADFLQDPSERAKLAGMKALVIRSNNLGETINSTIKRDFFMEETAGLQFRVDVDTFFQVNRSIIPKWLEYIKTLILKHDNVGQGLLDLYSGVGTISQYLAPHFEQVVGIEVNKTLVDNGNKVLQINKIDNARFIVADASRFFDYGLKYDTVIINPPRKGISRGMVKTLSEAKPEVIIYSSCNPDTFSRDIRHLSESGYNIDEIQPFDMFPQTQHSEVVGVLYLK